MIHRTNDLRRAHRGPADPRPAGRPRSRGRRPSYRRRIRRRVAAIAAAAAIVAAALVHILITHANTTFNEIAIQPRPDSPATAGADVAAELGQAAANGGQLLITEIAGGSTAAPALTIDLSCPPGTNGLICEQTLSRARHTATSVARSLVDRPAPAALDFYAVFEQTAGYLSETSARYQHVNLWINTTGAQLNPVNLTRLTGSSDLSSLARQATATGAFPGPHGCDGYQVHMVVPPSGTPAHQQALRSLVALLVRRCGGTLTSWTSRWIALSSGALALPPLTGATVVPGRRGASYILSDKLDDFAVGSAMLTPIAKSALRSIAVRIEARAPGQRVTCTGSTDGTGMAAFDLALSRRRAAAVCDYLGRQGIDRRLLVRVGTGKATPVAADPSLRRVTITTGGRS